ncbi:hypothetical protein Gasu2_33480 [Galdieria sulphuraria]|nr:hypothetical protein Gasu2_33480 [Galdieria sulphuraria]
MKCLAEEVTKETLLQALAESMNFHSEQALQNSKSLQSNAATVWERKNLERKLEKNHRCLELLKSTTVQTPTKMSSAYSFVDRMKDCVRLEIILKGPFNQQWESSIFQPLNRREVNSRKFFKEKRKSLKTMLLMVQGEESYSFTNEDQILQEISQLPAGNWAERINNASKVLKKFKLSQDHKLYVASKAYGVVPPQLTEKGELEIHRDLELLSSVNPKDLPSSRFLIWKLLERHDELAEIRDCLLGKRQDYNTKQNAKWAKIEALLNERK